MPTRVRVATFNLENLDDKPGQKPTLADRITVMRPQLLRLRADVLSLQEIHGQEGAGHPRRLLALQQLLAGTPYERYHLASTRTTDGSQVYDDRNLVILSRFPIGESRQYKHDFTPKPAYRKVTANPPDTQASDVTWERPILYAKIDLPDRIPLHVINLHLKSKRPSTIPGQKLNQHKWRSVSGWAEGFFLSSLKRVGQAMETRVLVDQLFDQDPEARIVVCGDVNADHDAVPMQAIRGDVQETGNAGLGYRVLVVCGQSVPESSRFSLYHHGRPVMLDHLLTSRAMLSFYRGTEIHNELLADESVSQSDDKKFPQPDHAPVVAEFVLE